MASISWSTVKSDAEERQKKWEEENQGSSEPLLPDGWYDASFTKAESTRSKGGAPQIICYFEVESPSGEMVVTRNWLTFSYSDIGVKIAMENLMDLGLDEQNAPPVEFDESNNWHETDTDAIVSVIDGVREITDGAGYRIKVKNKDGFTNVQKMLPPDGSITEYMVNQAAGGGSSSAPASASGRSSVKI